MELTVRQMEIIETIKKCRNTATGKTLAKATGYSLRTIQAEMNICERSCGLFRRHRSEQTETVKKNGL